MLTHSPVLTLWLTTASLFQLLFKRLLTIPVSNTVLWITPELCNHLSGCTCLFYHFLALTQAILCKFASYSPGELLWDSSNIITCWPFKATAGQNKSYNLGAMKHLGRWWVSDYHIQLKAEELPKYKRSTGQPFCKPESFYNSFYNIMKNIVFIGAIVEHFPYSKFHM